MDGIKHLMARDWIVKVTHVFREANRCADWLAGFAFTQTLGIHFFDHHPMGLGSLLLADICGVSWPRVWFSLCFSSFGYITIGIQLWVWAAVLLRRQHKPLMRSCFVFLSLLY